MKFYYIIPILFFAALTSAACTGYVNGNWVIAAADNCANASTTIYLTGNLTVNGILNLTNVTLIANSTYNGTINITVTPGGSLKINDTDNSASTINDASNLTTNNTNLQFMLRSWGNLTITNSILSNIGYLLTGQTNYVDNLGIAVMSNYTNITYNRFAFMYDGIFPGANDSWISYTNISYNNFTNSYNFAIHLQNATYTTITGNNINLSQGGAGIYALDSRLNNYTYNNVSYNDPNGIWGHGLWLVNTSNDTISFNNMTGNTPHIYADFMNYTTIANNTFGKSTGGVQLRTSYYNTLQNNTFTNATNQTFFWGNALVLIDNSNYNDISYNTITNSTYAGIYLTSSNNTVFANILTDNYGYGILFASSTGSSNNILNNTLSTAIPDSTAIYLDGTNNTINNNTITKTNNIQAILIMTSRAEIQNTRLYNNNTINGKPIQVYGTLEATACPNNGNVIVGNDNTSMILLLSCNNVTVKDGSMNNSDTIYLANTNNSAITNVSINFSYYSAYLDSAKNTSIRNSTFNNDTFGVYILSASNSLIQNNTITNASFGVFTQGTNTNLTIYNNTFTFTQNPIELIAVNNSNVSYNQFNSNLASIYLQSASHNTLHDNNVSYNEDGIILFFPASVNNTIRDNTLLNNSLFNIYSQGTDSYIYDNNNSFSTYGIYFFNANNNYISDRIYNNTYGAYFDNVTGNNVTNSTFDNNTYHLLFNNTRGNYVINSTLSNDLTNQTISNNSAYDYLLNNTGVNASRLEFSDATSNLTILQTVSITSTNAFTGQAIPATISVGSQQGTALLSAGSPIVAYQLPTYLARRTTPLNYTPHTLSASLAGYTSNSITRNIIADAIIEITLIPLGSSNAVTVTPSPTPQLSTTAGQTVSETQPTPTPSATLVATPKPTAKPNTTAKPTANPSITIQPTSQATTQTAKTGLIDLIIQNALLIVILLIILAIIVYLSLSRKNYKTQR